MSSAVFKSYEWVPSSLEDTCSVSQVSPHCSTWMRDAADTFCLYINMRADRKEGRTFVSVNKCKTSVCVLFQHSVTITYLEYIALGHRAMSIFHRGWALRSSVSELKTGMDAPAVSGANFVRFWLGAGLPEDLYFPFFQLPLLVYGFCPWLCKIELAECQSENVSWQLFAVPKQRSEIKYIFEIGCFVSVRVK